SPVWAAPPRPAARPRRPRPPPGPSAWPCPKPKAKRRGMETAAWQNWGVDHRDLAAHLLARARALGADAADVLIGEGTDFSVTVRMGEVETLKDAGSKALGLRVFVGRRTASTYTSDFSPAALETLVGDTVAMARVTGQDPAPGLPDEPPPPDE